MSYCEYCGKEFESKRADARYCSTKHRKAANRIKCDNPVTDKLSVTEPDVSVTQTPLSVTDSPVSVTVPSLSVTVPERFEDLPEDVQAAMEYMSRRDGVDYETEKAVRTKRAWAYQAAFPDRWYKYGRGVRPAGARPKAPVTARPGEPDYPQERYGGVCQVCGAQTELKSITCCHTCVSAKYKEAV